MKHFHHFKKQDLIQLTRIRRYETKLGQKIRVIERGEKFIEALAASPAPFVLAGIPESIGVVANHGNPGTETAWPAFLQRFVNLQSTDRFTGEELILAGAFDFSAVQATIDAHAKNEVEKIDACRHAVANIIDEEVEQLVRTIVAAGKMPILIGGGHNNAYPLIKGAAKALFKTGKSERPLVHAVNLDAHADFRIMEGRHSGNGFRYAMEEGYLGRYAIIGLHENYNPQSMVDDLYSNVNIQYSFYEDIFLHQRLDFLTAMAQAFSFTDGGHTVVELDLDAVENIPSSAGTPSGISVMQARQYLNFAGSMPHVAGLHICEGAEPTDPSTGFSGTGKLIAYLVSDFIKSRLG